MTTPQRDSSTDNVQVTGCDARELENGSGTAIGTVVPGDQVLQVFGLSPATSYQAVKLSSASQAPSARSTRRQASP
jgi:hypothetical protein